MRKIITSILLFLVGLVVLDRAAGLLLGAMLEDVQTGQSVGWVNRALANAHRELIVFGSSRARHHIDPSLLSRELGVTAYNAGCDGQGLPYARMLEALMLTRGTSARLFVLNIDPADLFQDKTSRASLFAAFFGESEAVDEILRTTSWTARFKLASHTYRFNSLIIPMVRNWLAPQPEPADGFEPLRGGLSPLAIEMAARPLPAPVPMGSPLETLPKMERLLGDFLADAREHGIATLMVVGPRFRAGLPITSWELAAYERIAAIADAHGAAFVPLDGSTEPELIRPSLFRDRAHLNADGAAIFSHRVAEEIRKLDLRDGSGP